MTDEEATAPGLAPWWHEQQPLLAHPLGAWMNVSAPALRALTATPAPKLRIVDSPTRIEVEVDLGGWDTSRIEVETVGSHLVIRGGGDRDDITATGSGVTHRPFTRAVLLPEDVEGSFRRVSVAGSVLTMVLRRSHPGFWRRLFLRLWRWLRSSVSPS
ncbi:MAG: Hsp20 family protein [Deltaproteobacteria bacterium]|nr:Hsp20 family protein [Deltaproteobacteria bacterium]MBW2255708.1 Hsp20 family protein [Deltaproteobacteria bacterium]